VETLDYDMAMSTHGSHNLVDGGDSKLCFGDENPEINLRLDSFFLEGFV
jgi:hypothetical protein